MYVYPLRRKRSSFRGEFPADARIKSCFHNVKSDRRKSRNCLTSATDSVAELTQPSRAIVAVFATPGRRMLAAPAMVAFSSSNGFHFDLYLASTPFMKLPAADKR